MAMLRWLQFFLDFKFQNYFVVVINHLKKE